MDFLKHVPKGFTLRPEQDYILRELSENWDNSDTFLIDAPVGVGKSLIAMTVGNALKSAHILTPKKSLQEQYHASFPATTSVIVGRANYPCLYEAPERSRDVMSRIEDGKMPKRFMGLTCASEKRHCSEGLVAKRECYDKIGVPCPFDYAIEVAQKSPIVLHNITGFCFHAAMHGKFEQREVLVVDEAHVLPGILREVGAYTGVFTEEEAERIGIGSEEHFDLASLSQTLEGINHDRRVLDKAEAPSLNVRKGYATMTHVGSGKYRLKVTSCLPSMYYKHFVEPFGNKRILMTGSVANSDQFLRWFNLTGGDVHSITVEDSPFPVSNREIKVPMHLTTDMSYGNRPRCWEQAAKNIQTLMDGHRGERGVVHTNSYAFSRFLAETLKDPRCVIPLDGREHKPLFEKFMEGGGDGVFFSPAISEGVDLKDDLARFQIIPTLSFPPLSGFLKAIKTNYPGSEHSVSHREVALTLMQQTGRVVRHGEDFGVTYVLDSRLKRHLTLGMNSEYYPSWFIEAVRVQLTEGGKEISLGRWMQLASR